MKSSYTTLQPLGENRLKGCNKWALSWLLVSAITSLFCLPGMAQKKVLLTDFRVINNLSGEWGGVMDQLTEADVAALVEETEKGLTKHFATPVSLVGGARVEYYQNTIPPRATFKKTDHLENADMAMMVSVHLGKPIGQLFHHSIQFKLAMELKDKNNQTILDDVRTKELTIKEPYLDYAQVLHDTLNFYVAFPVNALVLKRLLAESILAVLAQSPMEKEEVIERPVYNGYQAFIKKADGYKIALAGGYGWNLSENDLIPGLSKRTQSAVIKQLAAPQRNGFLTMKVGVLNNILSEEDEQLLGVINTKTKKRKFTLGNDLGKNYFVVARTSNQTINFMPGTSYDIKLLLYNETEKRPLSILTVEQQMPSNQTVKDFIRSVSRLYVPEMGLSGNYNRQSFRIQTNKAVENNLEFLIDNELVAVAVHQLVPPSKLLNKSHVIPHILYIKQGLPDDTRAFVEASFQLLRLGYGFEERRRKLAIRRAQAPPIK